MGHGHKILSLKISYDKVSDFFDPDCNIGQVFIPSAARRSQQQLLASSRRLSLASDEISRSALGREVGGGGGGKGEGTASGKFSTKAIYPLCGCVKSE